MFNNFVIFFHQTLVNFLTRRPYQVLCSTTDPPLMYIYYNNDSPLFNDLALHSMIFVIPLDDSMIRSSYDDDKDNDDDDDDSVEGDDLSLSKDCICFSIRDCIL